MKRGVQVFLGTLKKSRGAIASLMLSMLGSAVVFYLYHLPPEPFFYVGSLLFTAGIAVFVFVWIGEIRKAAERERMIRSVLTEEVLPPASTLAEKDCQEAIRRLRSELTKLQNEYEAARQEEIDYYTAWVHQIKTPIAVLRMELGGKEGEDGRVLEAELFRIEQYVDMVLQYIRLGSGSNDLLIREYPLDDMIREAIRKFAPQFVSKRLHLTYEGTGCVLITDKKWFSCILEQLLSNAVKYTQSGGITISAENDRLSISDTGIGIAPDDLPRIFEKGYTGENGRFDKRASGLGLYLCKKSADLLRIPLRVESTVGQGSTFALDLTEHTAKKRNQSVDE